MDDTNIENETFSDWEDDDNDYEEKMIYHSLINPNQIFNTIESLIDYDKLVNYFDFIDVLKLIDYNNDIEIIQLINYIRYKVKKSLNSQLDSQVVNNQLVKELINEIRNKYYILDDYMIPQLNNDHLLISIHDFIEDYFINNQLVNQLDNQIDSHINNNIDNNLDNNIVNLLDHNIDSKVDSQLDSQSVSKVEDLLVVIEKYKSLLNDILADDNSNSNNNISINENYNDINESAGYYEGYSHYSIHETMLRDQSRTLAYRSSMINNSDYFNDKIVLDVGCGTGILSLFAAKAGAKKVFAIDNSNIINKTKQIIKTNNYSNIQLIHGIIESIDLSTYLSNQTIDVIVSEWMGYSLYYENMLSSIIHTRDRYLSPNGIILPSHSLLYIESCNLLTNRLDWLDSVYDFDLSDLSDLLTNEVQIEQVVNDDVISNRYLLHQLDMKIVTDEDLDFTNRFTTVITKDSCFSQFVVTFDCLFQHENLSYSTVLSTAVNEPLTHWKHAVFYLTKSNRYNVMIGDQINGSISYTRRLTNRREYDITIEWNVIRQIDSKVDSKIGSEIDKYNYKQSFVLY